MRTGWLRHTDGRDRNPDAALHHWRRGRELICRLSARYATTPDSCWFGRRETNTDDTLPCQATLANETTMIGKTAAIAARETKNVTTPPVWKQLTMDGVLGPQLAKTRLLDELGRAREIAVPPLVEPTTIKQAWDEYHNEALRRQGLIE